MSGPSVARGFQGQWIVYGSGSDGHLVTRQYFGYTRREAVAMWRREMRAGAR